MSDNGIVWEEPKQVTGSYTNWNALLAPLRERPLEWYRLRTYRSQGSVSGALDRLKRAKKVHDIDNFQVTTSKLSDTEWGLYARFIGTKEPA